MTYETAAVRIFRPWCTFATSCSALSQVSHHSQTQTTEHKLIYTATVPLAAADIPTTFWRNAETTSAPASTAGMACVDSCGDCMPKLCTDDAVIKGTTTHLTYLCPETKTVQVTETVFITVNGNESKLPTTSASV